MRLRLLCAASVLLVSLPSFATPVAITPGATVTPGTGTYGGSRVDYVTGTNNAGTVSYSDAVYADPNNPFCAGCYDFVVQLGDNNPSTITTGVTTSGFNGDKFSLEVAYAAPLPGQGGYAAPVSATEGPGGSNITFNFTLDYPQETDPLIIYTNAQSDKNATLTIATNREVIDPASFAPSGPAIVASTPEPSSLMLLGTGVLGVFGARRRRTA